MKRMICSFMRQFILKSKNRGFDVIFFVFVIITYMNQKPDAKFRYFLKLSLQ